MEAHTSQISARKLMLNCSSPVARLRGLRAGIGHAIALFLNTPLVLESLDPVSRARAAFDMPGNPY